MLLNSTKLFMALVTILYMNFSYAIDENSTKNESLSGTSNSSPLIKRIPNSINISTTRIEMKRNQKSTFFTLTNKSETEQFGFSISVVKWSQKDGNDVYEENNNIISSPKTFVLAPGQYKNIRLLAKNYPEALKDYSYRLVINQVARNSIQDSGNGANQLQMKFEISFPMFFYSNSFREHDLLNIEKKIDVLNKKIYIKNNDTQYIYIKGFNIDGKNYRYSWYLLPKTEINLDVVDLIDLGQSENHKIEILTDRTIIK